MPKFAAHPPQLVGLHLLLSRADIVVNHALKDSVGGAEASFKVQVRNNNVIPRLPHLSQNLPAFYSLTKGNFRRLLEMGIEMVERFPRLDIKG